MNDWELLQDYVVRGSETAFRALVSKHLPLVHSSALRQVNDPHRAEEVSQAVFILLARKAPTFRRGVILAGWLFRTTRFVAARAERSERRRQRREQEAFAMQQLATPTDQTWTRLRPILDDALAQLGEMDRNAVLLRFFEDRNHRQVGAALGLSEEAAKKRVSRALERLRQFFARRGFALSITVLASALSANAVLAAPSGLAEGVTAAASAGRAATTVSLPSLVSETLRAWRWARLRLAVAVGAILTVGMLLLGVVVPRERSVAPSEEPDRPKALAASPTARFNGMPAKSAPASTGAGRDLRLTVVDAETGRALAGVGVHVRVWLEGRVGGPDDLVTDREGLCEVPLPKSDLGRLDVGVLIDGYVQKFVSWYAFQEDPVPSEYVFRLERGAPIGGWVTDESGSPIVEAEISVGFPGSGDRADQERQRERVGFIDDLVVVKTAWDGSWFCSVVPTNESCFQVKVRHPDFETATYFSDADPHDFVDAQRFRLQELQNGRAVLVLRKGVLLTGQVVDDRQVPVADATVELDPSAGAPERSVRTDASGSFVFPHVRVGEWPVKVSAPAFAPTAARVTVSLDRSTARIELSRETVLRLRVVDQRGVGVPQAIVLQHDLVGGSPPGTTDLEGRLQVVSAAGRAVQVSVFKSGFFSSRDNLLQADGDERVIVLSEALEVTGYVVDAQNRRPIAEFKAIPGFGIERPIWFRGDLKLGEGGRYSLSFSEGPTDFAVRIEADGYEPAWKVVTGPTCDFELTKAAPSR